MATITSVKDRINQMNQSSFQILCDAFLAREGYPGIVALGTKDGAEKTTQGTPDTYFCLSGGKYVFAEYTTQKRGLLAKIQSDIEKCLNEELTNIPVLEIIEIVYCHTSSNIKPFDDRNLRLYCEKKGVKLTLIGIDTLAEKLMNYPIIIKEHLGINIDSEQIQTADDFVKQYNSNATAATLETDFLFREKEFDSLNKAFDNVNTVLLVGSAGTGKTRLALEYAKNHAKIHSEILLCIHDRSIPIYEDLKMYFEKSGKYFIFIDDANQLSELEHVVEYINKVDSGYRVRILMTVRDYAVSKVKLDLNGIVNYETINLIPFSDDEITSLMKRHYGILNQDYLDRIVQISNGNARIAMLAGRIACNSNQLESINDVTELYDNYFGKTLYETGFFSDRNLLISVGIMAFLNAIHLDYIDPIVPILEDKGLTKADFVLKVHLLHDYEIVDICNDKGVKFSDQCMANFILKYVLIEKKIIKLSILIESCFGLYRERTIHAVNTLLGVFQNAEVRKYIEEEVLSLWKKLETDKSPMFFDFLKTFFPINELESLLIIQKYIEDETAISLSADEVNTEEGKNYQSISNDKITILGGYTYLENLDSALDLFFQYYLKRPDLYMQFYHASITFFSIDKHSKRQGYQSQIKYFTKIQEYTKNRDNPLIDLLFIEVASHFLQLDFSPHEGTRDGKGITVYNIPLSLTSGVKEYRKLVWEHLILLALEPLYCTKLRGILRTYGQSIHDCSKEVIKSDEGYIIVLSRIILSTEYLTDCLIAESLQKVFEVAEYQTIELQPFFNSSKYRLYQIINGSRRDFDLSYEEFYNKKKKDICDYMIAPADKPVAFEEILKLFIECRTQKGCNSYEIAEGLDIAIQSLNNNGEDYLRCVSMLLSSEIITGIRINHIVKTLFSILDTQDVLDLLNQSCESNKNEWLYSYYHEIPQVYINQMVLDGLYEFLMDNSDNDMKSYQNRDISFLDKYLSVDNYVIIKASTIIFKKKEYSSFIVNLYFESQFNEHYIQPNYVIQKFAQNINLLEQIYLFVIENSQYIDYRGTFLHTLFQADKSFVREYAKWIIVKQEKKISQDHELKIEIFYEEQDYLDILDFIVDESITTYSFSTYKVTQIIKQIIILTDNKKDFEKCDYWIKHFIEKNHDDKKKMVYLFEAISEKSIELNINYIALLVSYTVDYDVFESIPLTPLSYSCYGSCVPLYSSWVGHLERLLPIFSGLKYIKHKNKIQQLIEYYRNRIKEVEISDILEG